jgi:hypothetical protein
MPLELRIWRLGAKPERIAFSAIGSEKRLEEALVQDFSILSPDLLLIGRQIRNTDGRFIPLAHQVISTIGRHGVLVEAGM